MINYDTVERWRDEYYLKLRDCKKAMMTNNALSHAYNCQKLKEFMEQLIGRTDWNVCPFCCPTL